MEGRPLKAATVQAGKALERKEWLDLRERAIFKFCKWDVQCEDHSVLAQFPLLLDRKTAAYLNETAEVLSDETREAESEILKRPDLIDRLALPRRIRNVFREESSRENATRNVRVMRFDFHPTTAGWKISEVNADVPGGFVEGTGWNSLFAEKWAGAQAPPEPSERYAQAILEAVGANGLVALVHATAYSDDRQVMEHLARCFSKHGLRTCLVSPTHLHWNGKRPEIRAAFASGAPDGIVRFFPAEWLPNLADERQWRFYFQTGEASLSNPGCAILLQSKRFPLIWNDLDTDLSTWRRLLPETRDVAELNGSLDESWVLKPALGRVGEKIGICGITSPRDFQAIVREVQRRNQNWIAQKRFDIVPVSTEAGRKYPCIGVFTINGKAAGYYGRVADTPIVNQNAQDAAVLILAEQQREVA